MKLFKFKRNLKKKRFILKFQPFLTVEKFALQFYNLVERSKLVKVEKGRKKMNISDIIESFINERISGEGGYTEIRRNELAEHLGCVPSQINYVISTRFTAERGYTVESRRGGGGYISIKRVIYPANGTIMHVVNSIGDSIDFASAKAIIKSLYEYDVISRREAEIMISALGDRALLLPREQRGMLRARLLKNMLMQLT